MICNNSIKMLHSNSFAVEKSMCKNSKRVETWSFLRKTSIILINSSHRLVLSKHGVEFTRNKDTLSKVPTSKRNKRLHVSHHIHTCTLGQEVWIEMRENLHVYLRDYSMVWVSYYLAKDQQIPFKAIMTQSLEDNDIWRAKLGIFTHTTFLRYEVFASGVDYNLKPLLLRDKCQFTMNSKHQNQIFLPVRRQTLNNATVEHISTMSRIIGTYMYLNEYLFTQDIEKQIDSCRKQPVRNLTKNVLAQQFLSEHKIFISLTTSPKRIQYVAHVLRSLDLSLVEKILISIPERYGRDGSEYEIPTKLLDFPKVQILWIPLDLGPITKLLPAAEYVQKIDPDSLIITIDDDVGYPIGMIAEYVHAIVQRDNTVVGMRGFDMSYWKIHDFGFPNPQQGPLMKHPQVQILEGFCGIAYRAKFIDVELMKYLSRKDLFPECFVSDDLVISFALALSKVDRVAVSTRFYNIRKICPLKYGFEADALHQGGGMDLCVINNPIGLNALKYTKSYNQLIDHTFDFERQCLKSREDILQIGARCT